MTEPEMKALRLCAGEHCGTWIPSQQTLCEKCTRECRARLGLGLPDQMSSGFVDAVDDALVKIVRQRLDDYEAMGNRADITDALHALDTLGYYLELERADSTLSRPA